MYLGHLCGFIIIVIRSVTFREKIPRKKQFLEETVFHVFRFYVHSLSPFDGKEIDGGLLLHVFFKLITSQVFSNHRVEGGGGDLLVS